MKIHNYKSLILLISTLPLSNQLHAADNSVWLGVTQNQSDYFDDGSSSFEPVGYTLGYSRQFNDNWQMMLAYNETEGSGKWPVENSGQDLFSRADSESSNASITLGWIGEAFSLSATYSELDNKERTATWMPHIVEISKTNNRVFSFNFDTFSQQQAWLFAWDLGIQYAENDSDNLQLILVDPPATIAARFNQTNWSVFSQLDVSRTFDENAMSWTPQFSLAWDWEISSSGDPLVLFTRGDQRRRISQLNNRFINSFRTPDSGFWELSFAFDWHNDWHNSIGFARSISAPIETNSLSLDISLDF